MDFPQSFAEGMSSYLEFNTRVMIDLSRFAYLYFSTINGSLIFPGYCFWVDDGFLLQFTVHCVVGSASALGSTHGRLWWEQIGSH